jgi:hypothetical protein
MEYFLGSISTIIAVVAVNILTRKSLSKNKVKLKRSQSHLYKLLSDISLKDIEKSNKEKQSGKYLKKYSVKVMIVEDKAYWIKDNQLYVADCNRADIDGDSTSKVDTMAMDAVELEKTMFIVEKLSEDK